MKVKLSLITVTDNYYLYGWKHASKLDVSNEQCKSDGTIATLSYILN